MEVPSGLPYATVCVIKRDGNDGPRYTMESPTCTLGRGMECDIRIQLQIVSDEHCRIEVDPIDMKLYLVNISEEGPTLLNGAVITSRTALNHRDVITVGDRLFRVEKLPDCPPPKVTPSPPVVVAPPPSEPLVEMVRNLVEADSTNNSDISASASQRVPKSPSRASTRAQTPPRSPARNSVVSRSPGRSGAAPGSPGRVTLPPLGAPKSPARTGSTDLNVVESSTSDVAAAQEGGMAEQGDIHKQRGGITQGHIVTLPVGVISSVETNSEIVAAVVDAEVANGCMINTELTPGTEATLNTEVTPGGTEATLNSTAAQGDQSAGNETSIENHSVNRTSGGDGSSNQDTTPAIGGSTLANEIKSTPSSKKAAVEEQRTPTNKATPFGKTTAMLTDVAAMKATPKLKATPAAKATPVAKATLTAKATPVAKATPFNGKATPAGRAKSVDTPSSSVGRAKLARNVDPVILAAATEAKITPGNTLAEAVRLGKLAVETSETYGVPNSVSNGSIKTPTGPEEKTVDDVPLNLDEAESNTSVTDKTPEMDRNTERSNDVEKNKRSKSMGGQRSRNGTDIKPVASKARKSVGVMGDAASLTTVSESVASKSRKSVGVVGDASFATVSGSRSRTLTARSLGNMICTLELAERGSVRTPKGGRKTKGDLVSNEKTNAAATSVESTSAIDNGIVEDGEIVGENPSVEAVVSAEDGGTEISSVPTSKGKATPPSSGKKSVSNRKSGLVASGTSKPSHVVDSSVGEVGAMKRRARSMGAKSESKLLVNVDISPDSPVDDQSSSKKEIAIEISDSTAVVGKPTKKVSRQNSQSPRRSSGRTSTWLDSFSSFVGGSSDAGSSPGKVQDPYDFPGSPTETNKESLESASTPVQQFQFAQPAEASATPNVSQKPSTSNESTVLFTFSSPDQGHQGKSLKKKGLSMKGSPKTLKNETTPDVKSKTPVAKKDVTPKVGGRKSLKVSSDVGDIESPDLTSKNSPPHQGIVSSPSGVKSSKKKQMKRDSSLIRESPLISDACAAPDDTPNGSLANGQEPSPPKRSKLSKNLPNTASSAEDNASKDKDAVTPSMLEIPSNAVALRAIYGKASIRTPSRNTSPKSKSLDSVKKNSSPKHSVVQPDSESLKINDEPSGVTNGVAQGLGGKRKSTGRKSIGRKSAGVRNRLWSEVVSAGVKVVGAGTVEAGNKKVANLKIAGKKKKKKEEKKEETSYVADHHANEPATLVIGQSKRRQSSIAIGQSKRRQSSAAIGQSKKRQSSIAIGQSKKRQSSAPESKFEQPDQDLIDEIINSSTPLVSPTSMYHLSSSPPTSPDNQDIPATPEGPGEMFVSPLTTSKSSTMSKRRSVSTMGRRTLTLPSNASVASDPVDTSVIEAPESAKNDEEIETKASLKKSKKSGVTTQAQKALTSTPALGGIKRLLQTPKVGAKTPKLDGVKRLMKTPKSETTPRLDGVRELMQTTKTQGTPDLTGVRGLVQTPAQSKTTPVLAGVRELMKTPKGLSTPQFGGIKKMLRTTPFERFTKKWKDPKRDRSLSPSYEGVGDLLATPQLIAVDLVHVDDVVTSSKSTDGGVKKMQSLEKSSGLGDGAKRRRTTQSVPATQSSPRFDRGATNIVETVPSLAESSKKKSASRAKSMSRLPVLSDSAASTDDIVGKTPKVSKTVAPSSAGDVGEILAELPSLKSAHEKVVRKSRGIKRSSSRPDKSDVIQIESSSSFDEIFPEPILPVVSSEIKKKKLSKSVTPSISDVNVGASTSAESAVVVNESRDKKRTSAQRTRVSSATSKRESAQDLSATALAASVVETSVVASGKGKAGKMKPSKKMGKIVGANAEDESTLTTVSEDTSAANNSLSDRSEVGTKTNNKKKKTTVISNVSDVVSSNEMTSNETMLTGDDTRPVKGKASKKGGRKVASLESSAAVDVNVAASTSALNAPRVNTDKSAGSGKSSLTDEAVPTKNKKRKISAAVVSNVADVLKNEVRPELLEQVLRMLSPQRREPEGNNRDETPAQQPRGDVVDSAVVVAKKGAGKKRSAEVDTAAAVFSPKVTRRGQVTTTTAAVLSSKVLPKSPKGKRAKATVSSSVVSVASTHDSSSGSTVDEDEDSEVVAETSNASSARSTAQAIAAAAKKGVMKRTFDAISNATSSGVAVAFSPKVTRRGQVVKSTTTTTETVTEAATVVGVKTKKRKMTSSVEQPPAAVLSQSAEVVAINVATSDKNERSEDVESDKKIIETACALFQQAILTMSPLLSKMGSPLGVSNLTPKLKKSKLSRPKVSFLTPGTALLKAAAAASVGGGECSTSSSVGEPGRVPPTTRPSSRKGGSRARVVEPVTSEIVEPMEKVARLVETVKTAMRPKSTLVIKKKSSAVLADAATQAKTALLKKKSKAGKKIATGKGAERMMEEDNQPGVSSETTMEQHIKLKGQQRKPKVTGGDVVKLAGEPSRPTEDKKSKSKPAASKHWEIVSIDGSDEEELMVDSDITTERKTGPTVKTTTKTKKSSLTGAAAVAKSSKKIISSANIPAAESPLVLRNTRSRK